MSTRDKLKISVGVVTRLHTPVTVRGEEPCETHADLDICAEADLVSVAFARKYKLEQTDAEIPELEDATSRRMPTYGVWKVPLFIVDSRGGARRITRLCVGVDRDPRLKGSLILLSMTTLTEYHIHLCPYSRQWWFEQQWENVEIQPWKQFRKGCRKRAHVFAVVQLQEFVPFPESSESTSQSDSGLKLPVEFSRYEDVFSLESSGTSVANNINNTILAI